MKEGHGIRRGFLAVALAFLFPLVACSGPLDPVVPDDDEESPGPDDGDSVGYVIPEEGAHLAALPPASASFPDHPAA